MSKKRDWVDYANLASNLAQNVQLDGIQDRLSGVQDAAAAQAQEARNARQAIEQAEQRIKRLANYRETVVEGERAMAGLRHNLPQHPLPVLAGALVRRHRHEESQLGTGCFESFEDKDRVERLLADLDDIIEASSNQLSEIEQRDAQQCLQYQLEEADLIELIYFQKRREEEVEELRKLAGEWNPKMVQLQEQLDSLNTEFQAVEQSNLVAEQTLSWKVWTMFSMFLAILASLSGLAFVCLLLLFFSTLASDENLNSLETRRDGMLLSILLVTLFWMFSYVVSPRHSPRSAQIKEEQAILEKRLTSITASVTKRPSAVSDRQLALCRTFGGDVATPSSFYEKMLAERRAFVSEVDYLQFPSL